MKMLSTVAASLFLLLGGAAAAVVAGEVFPAKGNEVVIYTHHFKPESFAAGLKLVEEGFTDAQTKMGQTRHNYFLVNSAANDVVVVSFFGKDESVEDWHKFIGRLDVLKQLEPMRREPLELERYKVDAITSTP